MSGRKFWAVALAVFLLVYGLLTLTNLRFDGQNLIMGVLAVATSILLFLDR